MNDLMLNTQTGYVILSQETVSHAVYLAPEFNQGTGGLNIFLKTTTEIKEPDRTHKPTYENVRDEKGKYVKGEDGKPLTRAVYPYHKVLRPMNITIYDPVEINKYITWRDGGLGNCIVDEDHLNRIKAQYESFLMSQLGISNISMTPVSDEDSDTDDTTLDVVETTNLELVDSESVN